MRPKTIKILAIAFFIKAIILFEIGYNIEFVAPAVNEGLPISMLFVTFIARICLYGIIIILYIFLIESLLAKVRK